MPGSHQEQMPQIPSEGMMMPAAGSAKIQMRETLVKEDTLFHAEMITTITKLLFEKRRLGIAVLSDKFMRLELTTPKDTQDKIN